MIKRMALATLLLACAGLWSAPALGSITCSVSANGVTFGVYNPLSGGNLDRNGSITFKCTSNTILSSGTVTFDVTLSRGSSGSFTTRAMNSGSDTLEYNLYVGSLRNTIWDDGKGSTGSRSGTFQFPSILSIGIVREASFTIYGRVFGGQFVPAGGYSDAITVTVLY